MDNEKILVTGGAGFIGANIANNLAKSNEVTVIDDLSLGIKSNLHNDIQFKQKSVLDDDLPTDVDIIFHFAARSSYPMHEKDPQSGAKTNIEGFVNVVEQARQDDCENIIYASTSSIYGNQKTPTPEDVPIEIKTGYEASKVSREKYGEYFINHYDMTIAGLRLFSVYQGYGGTEEHKEKYANIIAQFAHKITNGDRPVIYGDGTQTRDFTHVSDVVRAAKLVAENELSGIYNVGTGRRHDFNTVVQLLNKELNKNIEPKYIENPIPKNVYVHDTCADWSKLHEATSWEPSIAFNEGIKSVCEPYKEN